MKWWIDADSRRLMQGLAGGLTVGFLMMEGVFWAETGRLSAGLFLVWVLLSSFVLGLAGRFLARQEQRLTDASERIRRILAGETDLRLECSGEGASARLFHEVNTLAAVLNAHADNEKQEKVRRRYRDRGVVSVRIHRAGQGE